MGLVCSRPLSFAVFPCPFLPFWLIRFFALLRTKFCVCLCCLQWGRISCWSRWRRCTRSFTLSTLTPVSRLWCCCTKLLTPGKTHRGTHALYSCVFTHAHACSHTHTNIYAWTHIQAHMSHPTHTMTNTTMPTHAHTHTQNLSSLPHTLAGNKWSHKPNHSAEMSCINKQGS